MGKTGLRIAEVVSAVAISITEKIKLGYFAIEEEELSILTIL